MLKLLERLKETMRAERAFVTVEHEVAERERCYAEARAERAEKALAIVETSDEAVLDAMLAAAVTVAPNMLWNRKAAKAALLSAVRHAKTRAAGATP